MSDLEKFAHDDESRLPPLFRAGVLHYQFETTGGLARMTSKCSE